MSFRIVISGESQCDLFAEICLVADHLRKNLPNFCYDRIEKPVLDWEAWLCKVNLKNKWHHMGSPLIWKELMLPGSKAYYIGGASEFLEYCHSYYNFDVFLAFEKFEGLVRNYRQYEKKLLDEKQWLNAGNPAFSTQDFSKQTEEAHKKTDYIICISGASCPLALYLIAGLLDMSIGEKSISKIYIYDEKCSAEFMEYVERECSYIGTNNPGKVVKYIDKIGMGLTHANLLIVLDHVPFSPEMSIGQWLHQNTILMNNLSGMVNAAASRTMKILFANLGPACYNATILTEQVSSNINVKNIAVVTSDVGIEILPTLAEICEVPCRNIFCPPVWGFVGINHLVDVKTTVHVYNSFEPYTRYTRVLNSTLCIGSLTPELRFMEYLLYFDETLWKTMADKKARVPLNQQRVPINKANSVLGLVRMWFFDPNPDYIVNLGILCNGSFGLTFKGFFSQPAHIVDDKWEPAIEYALPRDPQMKLSYLQKMAEMMMELDENGLPPVVPYYPCSCKGIKYFKKHVW